MDFVQWIAAGQVSACAVQRAHKDNRQGVDQNDGRRQGHLERKVLGGKGATEKVYKAG